LVVHSLVLDIFWKNLFMDLVHSDFYHLFNYFFLFIVYSHLFIIVDWIIIGVFESEKTSIITHSFSDYIDFLELNLYLFYFNFVLRAWSYCEGSLLNILFVPFILQMLDLMETYFLFSIFVVQVNQVGNSYLKIITAKYFLDFFLFLFIKIEDSLNCLKLNHQLWFFTHK